MANRGSGAISATDKLQIAGLTTGYDRVVVARQSGAGSFSAFCYKFGPARRVESVNRGSDHVFGRKILGHEPVDRTGTGGRSGLRFEGCLDFKLALPPLASTHHIGDVVGHEAHQ